METMVIKLPPVISAALEVLTGAYGNGEDRKEQLEKAGYNYAEVQSCVNDLCSIIKKYG